MNKKQLIIIGVGIFLMALLIIVIVFGNKKDIVTDDKSEMTNEEEVILPTIDSSVKVDLLSSGSGREVDLSIKNIPGNVTAIDYELSYSTAQQGIQGVIGTIMLEGEKDFDKKITLGTCSSGTCVYHQVVGKVKLTLRFTGDSVDKVFEKEFEL